MLVHATLMMIIIVLNCCLFTLGALHPGADMHFHVYNDCAAAKCVWVCSTTQISPLPALIFGNKCWQ